MSKTAPKKNEPDSKSTLAEIEEKVADVIEDIEDEFFGGSRSKMVGYMIGGGAFIIIGGLALYHFISEKKLMDITGLFRFSKFMVNK